MGGGFADYLTGTGGLTLGGTTSNGQGTQMSTAVTDPWYFSGHTGWNRIDTTVGAGNNVAPSYNNTGGTDNLDLGAWIVYWGPTNSALSDIDMSNVDSSTLTCYSGPLYTAGSAGITATPVAAGSCAVGDSYTFDYSATVPTAVPGFGGFVYDLHLEGTVTSAVPIPAAAWLFGSGLLGLAGIARRKKTA